MDNVDNNYFDNSNLFVTQIVSRDKYQSQDIWTRDKKYCNAFLPRETTLNTKSPQDKNSMKEVESLSVSIPWKQ